MRARPVVVVLGVLAALPAIGFQLAPTRAAFSAERSTSARCRGLAARLRHLGALEDRARTQASRDQGASQSNRNELRLRRNMVRQAGCDLPMKPGDARQRRCFELRSRLEMARRRVQKPSPRSARSSRRLSQIRRQRADIRARYRLSGCPQGKVGAGN